MFGKQGTGQIQLLGQIELLRTCWNAFTVESAAWGEGGIDLAPQDDRGILPFSSSNPADRVFFTIANCVLPCGRGRGYE